MSPRFWKTKNRGKLNLDNQPHTMTAPSHSKTVLHTTPRTTPKAAKARTIPTFSLRSLNADAAWQSGTSKALVLYKSCCMNTAI
jgi:hypothetical protein